MVTQIRHDVDCLWAEKMILERAVKNIDIDHPMHTELRRRIRRLLIQATSGEYKLEQLRKTEKCKYINKDL